MDIKESKAGSKKTTPPSEWFKNVAKSIGYSSSEVIKEITPNVHSFVADNYNYSKELVEDFRDAKDNSKSVAEMLNLGSQMGALNTAVKNALDDIKSGKIYNKERAESFDDDDEFGAFLSGDFDMGDSSSSSSSSPQKPTVINNVKVMHDDNKLTSAITSAAEANLQGTQALMRQNKEVATATISMNHQLGMQMTKGLETINTNISQLVNFQNDSMAKYIGASIQYYDDSLKVMKDSLDKLVAMSPGPTSDRKERFNGYDAVFGGGSFNLQGYMENIQRNFERMKDENMLVQAVTSFIGEQDTLDRLAKSPLTFISDTITKKLIPMAIRESVKQFDESVTAFFPAMLDKFSRMGKGGNMFTETIGQLFGIDTSVKSSANMANYTRGAIPFDGETKRAITDIIPTYLRKIHSALSGGKEVAFDYETGKWDTVENMQKAYDKSRHGLTRAGYSDQIGDIETMINSVKFETQKQQEEFRSGIDKFLYELSRTTEQISFDNSSPDRSRANQEKVRELHSFGDPKMDKLMYSMMANLSRTQQMDLVGAGRYKNLAAMQNFFTDIEKSPTKHNASTLLSGMGHDEHVTLDADGKIKKVKASGLNRLDRYGHDDLYYLRTIASSLMQGIRVYPVTGKGKGAKKDNFIDSRFEQFSKQTTEKQDVKSTNIINYDSDKERGQENIVMGDLDVTDDIGDKLRSRVEHRKKMEKEKKSDAFGDTMRDLGFGSNPDSNVAKIKNLANEAISKPTQLLQKVFEKIDMTLYNVVFGIREDGKGSFMDRTLDKMTEMFAKVGDFATEKIFLPVSDFLLNTFDKVKGAASENPIVQGIKDGVKFWFVGEKDELGNRQGGVFSDIMNSTKDMAKSLNYAITGVGYTDSQGRKHDKNPDSIFGSALRVGKEIFSETKKHFFGDKDSDNPDNRSGMLLGIANTLGDGMADWSEILFGKQRDKDKTGATILRENTTSFVKAAPKGLMGALGGMGVGTVLAAGTGLLGSFLLPGAPIALALAGGALGMATGFESFNDWAFGEIGTNGKRIGGALVSANTKQFLKENKSKLVGGAVGGALLSMAIPAIADSIIPGSGMIMDFMSPFGVVGAAFQGMATAMVLKSESVMGWLFGAKDMNGERVGGALTRLFGKKSDDIAKKNVKSKLGMAAIGAVGGAVAGKLAGIGVGSALSGFGFLGALAATPFGPVGGALLGLGAAITLGSEKFRTFLFGKKDDESEIDDIGFFGRTMKMFQYEIITPFKDSVKDTIGDMTNWFSNKFMADVAFVTEPIVKAFKDTVSGTFKLLKGVVWDLPGMILKGTTSIISGAVDKMKNALKDSVVEKALIAPTKNFAVQAAGLILDPLRDFGTIVKESAADLFKAGQSLTNGMLMIPAMLKMGFDRTFETTKSLFKNVGSLFSSRDGEGLGSRVSNWWKQGRQEGRDKSSYVTELFANRSERHATYRAKKEEREAATRQRNEEYNAIRAAVRGTGYNQDAIDLMSDEDKASVNVFKTLSGKKMVTDQAVITKLQTDLFKATGLTVNDLFVLNPKEKLQGLNKNQINFMKTVIETSKKHGVRGDALKKKMDIGTYQMTQIDVTDSILDETKKMRELMEGLTSSIDKVIDSGTIKVNVDQMAHSVIDDMTKPTDSPNYDDLINNYRQTGQSANRRPFNTVNTINSPFRQNQVNTEQSTGGAIGGAVVSATRSIASRVTGAIGGMTKEVSKLGCGAIVLSKVLMDAGIRMTANEIYSFAEERGLVQPGVGMSSDVFKSVASARGLSYAFAKANRQGLERLFKTSNMVIARLSTGVGHFVVLHSYSKQENNVAIDDPMGKIGGVYSLDQILSMATHLYAVYRKGASSNPLKSMMKRASSRMTGSESSVGGAIGNAQASGGKQSSSRVAGIMNKLGLSSSLSSYIKDMGVLPVLAVRSKEEIAEERKMLGAMTGGGGGGNAVGTAHGVNRPGTMGTMVNPFNMISMVNMLFGAAGMVGQGIGGLMNMHRNGGIRNNAMAGAQGMYGKAQTKAAEAQMAPMSMLGAIAAGTGRLAAKPFRGSGTAGRRAIRSILSGRSAAIGAKISQELVQMGDSASRGNMSSLSGNYQTSADAGLVDDTGRLDINNFLKRQGEKMAAQAEANYRGSTVDLQTRIEINTRYTAQLAGEILDSMNAFNDWLKDWLNNFDPCCPTFPGGGGGGGGGFFVSPPIITNRSNTKNNRDSRNIFGGLPVFMGGDGGDGDEREIDIDLKRPKTKTGTARPTTTLPAPRTTTMPATRTATRPVARPIGLPMPQMPGLPEPRTTRRVRDAVTGEYRDLDIRDDVIDVDYRDVRDPKSIPVPEDPTKKNKTKKPGTPQTLALPMPQVEPVRKQGQREPELIPVDRRSSRKTKPMYMEAEYEEIPTPRQQPTKARPVVQDVSFGDDWFNEEPIEQATQGKPSSSAARPAGGYPEENYLDRYLNQSKEEFAQARFENLQQIDSTHEQKLAQKLRNGEISQEKYNTEIARHRKEMAKKFDNFDKDIDEGYSKIEEARSGKKVKPKGKVKSFFKEAAGVLKGEKMGIAAGANAASDIGNMLKNTGSKLFGGKKDKASKGVDLTKSVDKPAKKGLLSTLTKGIGKTAAKFVGGAATGGAVTAGMTALDAKYGHDNAASIMKKDPSKITAGDKAASATAQSVVGFVPLIDMADEMLGGHAKEWIAKLIAGLGPIWEKMKDKFSEAWESVKETVTGMGTKIKDAATEKWEGIKEGISTAWTSVTDKVKSVGSSIVSAASEKWESIKTFIGTKWDEAKTTVTGKLQSVIKSASDKWESIKTSISQKWDEAKTAVTGKLSGIAKAAGDKWEEIKTAIPKKFTEVKDKILEKLGGISVSVKGWAADIGSKVKDKILSGIGSLKVKIFGSGDTISLAGEKVVDKAKEVGKKVVSGVKTAGNKVKDTGKKAVNAVKETGNKAWNGVKNLASKFFGQGGPLPGELVPDAETFAKGCTDCKKNRKAKVTYGQGGGDIKGAYFSQKDSRWSGKQLAKGASMGDAGCGPTAIANVVTDLTGQSVLPTEAAKFAQNNGYVDPARGTDSNLFGDFAISKGVKVNQTAPAMDNIRSQLAMGNKVILRGEKGKNYTNAGHYIIADGIDGKGNISVKDPLGKGRSGAFSASDLQKGLTNAFVASTTGAGFSPTTKLVFAKGTKVGFANPMPAGRKTSGFGWRDIGAGREFHRGLDLSTGGGKKSQVQASADGVVVSAKFHNSYGNYIVIKHDMGREMTTVYAHLSEMKVGPGAKVKQGQVIGVEGTTGRSTGNHLHFEINEGPHHKDNARDPEHYIGKNGVPTPAPFNGDAGDMSGVVGAAASAWSLNNITSKFDTSSLYPSMLSNLPKAMEAMSQAFLFGAPVAGIASAIYGSMSGDGGVPTLTGNENSEKVWNFFKSQGFSNQAIAGIMGNLQQESGMDPTKKQSGGTAQGIAQWEGGRWTNLVNKAKAAGVSEWDLGIQLKHIVDELNGGDATTASILNKKYGGLQGLKSASDYKDATKIFQESFERAGKPMYEKRYGYAEQYLNMYNSTTGAGMLANPYKGLAVGGGIIDDEELEYNATGRGGNVVNLPQSKLELEKARAEQAAITAKGFGNINNIEAEHTKYENVRESSGKSSSITQVFGQGSDAWSAENVERAVSALEAIAANTAEAKTGINNINNNFTNNTVVGNSSSTQQQAQPAQQSQQNTRQLNQKNARRSSDIIRGRK